MCYEDTDECAAESHECSAFQSCVNTVGSYECNCAPGFRNNGVECVGKNLQKRSVFFLNGIIAEISRARSAQRSIMGKGNSDL